MGAWVEGVSVILPTSNDAHLLPRFFSALHTCEILEVVVVDHSSTDETISIVRQNGASVLRSDDPLDERIPDAIRMTRGTSVWFLSPQHRPTLQTGYEIMDCLHGKNVVAGFHHVRAIDGLSRLATLGANLAATWLGRYGLRNGPFFRRSVAEGIGATGSPTPFRSRLQEARKHGRVIESPDSLPMGPSR